MKNPAPYNPDAYQFTKAIHGHTEKRSSVFRRWNKILRGDHPTFTPGHLGMLVWAAADDWSGYWDEVPASSPDGMLMTYLAGKSW